MKTLVGTPDPPEPEPQQPVVVWSATTSDWAVYWSTTTGAVTLTA